ncbi:MAG: hypothetical protein AAFX01_03880 [Cyanobacteria bacterium J06638_28]
MFEMFWQNQPVTLGNELAGTLVWYSSEGAIPQDASAFVYWYTEGRGDRDQQTIGKIPLAPEQLIAGQQVDIPFAMPIPHSGPITYNGSLIRVIWAVQAWVKLPRIPKRDTTQTWPFQVMPR